MREDSPYLRKSNVEEEGSALRRKPIGGKEGWRQDLPVDIADRASV
jgi:hypothetical protein